MCRQGNCLRVNTPAGSNNGLALHWPLSHAGLAPDRLFARYYLKLSAGWSPNNCAPGTMQVVSIGGKFPGLADVRVNGDPEAPTGQCGNGGAEGDGINCWSHRAFFGGCETGNGGLSVCTTKPGAKARFGGYIYHGNGVDNRAFEAAPWDSDYWTQFPGNGCESDPFGLFCTLPASDRGQSAADPRNLLRNAGVLVGETWYAVELEIQMNTPGMNNGAIRGWMDGVLVYQKTNMVFRVPGHDGLHVRSFWMNVYHGGVDGACVNNTIWIDQLVLATGSPIGTLP